MRVSTIDDDVSLLEERYERLNKVVNGFTGLDEEDDLARALELLAEVLDGFGANDIGAFGLVLHKVVDLADGSVEGDNGEALVVLDEGKDIGRQSKFSYHSGECTEAQVTHHVLQ